MTAAEVGNLIKEKRKQLKLSQEDLAFAVSSKQSQISQIERGDLKGIGSNLMLSVLNELSIYIK